MRIADLTLEDVRGGGRWKAVDPRALDDLGDGFALEDLEIEPAADGLADTDVVVYACLFATDDGAVWPTVLVKEVQEIDYGGVYAELRTSGWRQIGLEPDPDAPMGREYVAAPLDEDPSFDADPDDYRDEHREGFAEYAPGMSVPG